MFRQKVFGQRQSAGCQRIAVRCTFLFVSERGMQSASGMRSLSVLSSRVLNWSLGNRSFSVSAEKPPFDKILIANRGEIACRVAKTARRMGIKTVAIYSEADARAVHVKACDEAVCVGPAASSQSYLNIDAIVEAMKLTGAQAVHPGYGFLSENAGFAERLEKEGLVFIGPGPFSIRSMGDKIESKKLAIQAGVNTIPGQLGLILTESDAVRVSKAIGYPVMIKASAGGGGKGMRIAHNDAEAAEGFRLSKAEASASFGDDRIFIEKFVQQPRHIEIQIIADKHGNVLYLPERECSIQRRNQKVIEEAPSPFLDEQTWRAMGEQAVSLAKAVHYHSAGTVEMMVDGDRNFYFLEMNTRLQVEHPVTELVTGFDLVEMMIRVAAGEKLKIHQDEIRPKGWAMESRIYAEDSLRNFLPSVGVLHRYIPPEEYEDETGVVRIDAGVEEGSEISIHYDPMIGKLVTHAPTRIEAINKMKTALDAFVVKGVRCNINFVRDVMDNPRFMSGDLTTHFIAQEYPPPGFRGHVLTELEGNELSAIAAMLHMQHKQQAKIFLQPEGSHVGGRQTVGRAALVSVMSPDHIIGEQELVVTIEGTVGEVVKKRLHIAARRPKLGDVISTEFVITIQDRVPRVLTADLPSNSGLYLAKCTETGMVRIVQAFEKTNSGYILSMSGSPYKITIRSERLEELSKYMPVKVEVDHSSHLCTPMPGKLHSIAVKEGESVIAGQEICVVEAMKMQNVLRAPKDSTVKKIHAKVGQNLALDECIMEFE
uniref:propionyl-CoA carboxylase n=1 Tax=Guillardia theta TaxID=55529 RepID=A0A7S4NLM6_GUITH|mmetsp:Transcript_25475/g.84255  ORF Transcript_25475/g.84255 Transcript_25475/m.84255 type:complete len:768 (+) Transcript_25475:64-2367(+)